MSTFDKSAFLARAFQEIDRVLDTSPGLSYRDISQAIGRNRTFLTDLKSDPVKYTLTVQDLVKLNDIYGADDIYIIKGIRWQAIKTKLDQLRPLLNSL